MKIKEKKIYILILIIFCILSVLIALKHEAWSDEAHAWLIARDTSFYTLFFKYLHTDGHPALWHIILKLFQFLGGTYETVFILPIIISTAGVGVFLFKSKFPLYLKMIIPFTYFIFFQYTIVVRGYCVIFLLVCLLATLWEVRKNKCFQFSFILLLLISSEAYTYVFSGIIYLYYLYDYYKERNSLKNKKQYAICLIVLLIFFIITFLYVCPISTNTFKPHIKSYYVSDSFVTPRIIDNKIKIIISLLLIISSIIFFIKNKNRNGLLFTFCLLFPVWCFYTIFYYNTWHLGIMLIFTIFIIWVQKLEDKKPIKIFLVIVSVIQLYWNISTCIYDVNYKYSSGLEVANFIKKYDYNEMIIYGSSFGDSAVNPYFDKNIFDNWNKDIGFFYWNTQNKFYNHDFNEQFILNDKPDMVVTSDLYAKLNYQLLSNLYNEYVFESYSYTEDFLYENMTMRVYVKKSIDKKGKIEEVKENA